MSSGVSDQMKVPGNTAKNADERNIPWSQQVDEASYENLASPTVDDNSGNNQSSMQQFQYPPFNVKETQNASWNNYKFRKSSNNTDKKYGKPAFYNNSKRDDFQPNAWSSNNTRRIISDNSPGNINRSHKDDAYTNEKLDNRPQDSSEENKKQNAPPTATAPKKTTWASIASQPAKLTARSTLTTSTHKKKGPGMPPPPMVPGKHNLDVNTWDLPNNNPPPVPSPPPPIDQTYCEINPEFPSNYGAEHELSTRPDNKASKGIDIPRDDNKSSYANSNFGRARNSPNGHTRKNWPTQHPLHQNRPVAPPASVPMRRIDGSNSSGGGNGSGVNPSRYNERSRGYYGGGSRYDQDISVPDNRDEVCLRNAENTCTVEEVAPGDTPQAVLEELRDKNNYNPLQIDLEKAAAARFFVIKSYSEDDIHRSIKYEIWCSTDHGNKRLDDAFKERHKEGGNILLFFSVNGSGHFCGMAQMMTAVDYNSTSSVWSQDKWKGKFKVKWIYVKDVPNPKLRQIRLENNDNKSVTNSRDTQEVPNAKGIEVLQILHDYKHSTSIFDDFSHYEKKQEEEVSSKKPLPSVITQQQQHQHQQQQQQQDSMSSSQNQSPVARHYSCQMNDDRDSRSGQQQQQQQPKYFNTGGGANFRERNTIHRGGNFQWNYNDHRRYDSHRTGGNSADYQYKERDDIDREQREESNDFVGGRKFEYNRSLAKHNNRDYNDEQNKSDTRFRAGPRDIQKDNEYTQVDRIRGIDY